MYQKREAAYSEVKSCLPDKKVGAGHEGNRVKQ